MDVDGYMIPDLLVNYIPFINEIPVVDGYIIPIVG